MAGIPEILIFLGVVLLVCLFIAFIHSWLGKESQPTGAGEKRESASTEDQSIRHAGRAARA